MSLPDFASVEQQARPALRNRPVGVVPFAGTDRTCMIACSREAKMLGVKNIMSVDEARSLCPDIVFVAQSPDLYRRAHNALVSSILGVVPITAVKSIDEITCEVPEQYRDHPEDLGHQIKNRILDDIGPYITCSIGFAGNRQLAKMACKAGKWNHARYGNGLNIWHPKDMPSPLLKLDLTDIPGVGSHMKKRLYRSRIYTIEDLYNMQPKHMRKLWHNVTGERLWYALHGYDIKTPPSERGMYGHGRVLPPESRSVDDAHAASRLLLTKAARRMRREGWFASRLWLWLSMKVNDTFSSYMDQLWLPVVQDDRAILNALEQMWFKAKKQLPKCKIIRLGVTLADLSPAGERQLDLLLNDDRPQQKWEKATKAIDELNSRYGSTVISLGTWKPPAGGYAGGKISYTRIPSSEDFW